MSYRLIRDSHPVARKDHKCIWCGQAIKQGSRYRYELSEYEGELQKHHWHTECEISASDYFLDFGPEFDLYENERPAE